MKKLLLIILSITLLIVSCGVNKSEEKKLEKLKVAANKGRPEKRRNRT